MVNRGSARTRPNKVPEIARFDRQRIGLAWLDQHGIGRPEERQLGADFVEADPETVCRQIEEGKLLLLDEGPHRGERLDQKLQLKMKGLDESAGAALSPEKQVRAALLHLVPSVEPAIDTVAAYQALPTS